MMRDKGVPYKIIKELNMAINKHDNGDYSSKEYLTHVYKLFSSYDNTLNAESFMAFFEYYSWHITPKDIADIIINYFKWEELAIIPDQIKNPRNLTDVFMQYLFMQKVYEIGEEITDFDYEEEYLTGMLIYMYALASIKLGIKMPVYYEKQKQIIQKYCNQWEHYRLRNFAIIEIENYYQDLVFYVLDFLEDEARYIDFDYEKDYLALNYAVMLHHTLKYKDSKVTSSDILNQATEIGLCFDKYFYKTFS